MAKFQTIIEAVLRNESGGELDRVEVRESPGLRGYVDLNPLNQTTALDLMRMFGSLSVGDTITIEERETEVE